MGTLQKQTPIRETNTTKPAVGHIPIIKLLHYGEAHMLVEITKYIWHVFNIQYLYIFLSSKNQTEKNLVKIKMRIERNLWLFVVVLNRRVNHQIPS